MKGNGVSVIILCFKIMYMYVDCEYIDMCCTYVRVSQNEQWTNKIKKGRIYYFGYIEISIIYF